MTKTEKNNSGSPKSSLDELKSQFEKAKEVFNKNFNTYNDLGVKMSQMAEKLGLKGEDLDSFLGKLTEEEKKLFMQFESLGVISDADYVDPFVSVYPQQQAQNDPNIYQDLIDAYKTLNTEYPDFIKWEKSVIKKLEALKK